MNIIFRIHAVQRMFERLINAEGVRHVLETGEAGENYPADKPYPSRLVLGWRGERPIHVVAAHSARDGQTIVITVYEPSPYEWEADFRRRKL